MRTRDLIKLAFQTHEGKVSLEQVYSLALEHRDDWEKFNSDYQHVIRTALRDLSRAGKVVREAKGTYKLTGEI